MQDGKNCTGTFGFKMTLNTDAGDSYVTLVNNQTYMNLDDNKERYITYLSSIYTIAY